MDRSSAKSVPRNGELKSGRGTDSSFSRTPIVRRAKGECPKSAQLGPTAARSAMTPLRRSQTFDRLRRMPLGRIEPIGGSRTSLRPRARLGQFRALVAEPVCEFERDAPSSFLGAAREATSTSARRSTLPLPVCKAPSDFAGRRRTSITRINRGGTDPFEHVEKVDHELTKGEERVNFSASPDLDLR